MQKRRLIVRGGPSAALKALGRDMARAYRIRPLAVGERRPAGYYTVNHYTGRGADLKKLGPA